MLNGLPRHDVVLWGVGHTNAHVLRMWRMHPIPGARLTCVTDAPIATYSGMLPAVLARELPRERMEIDLVRLCAATGARLVVGEVTGLDRARRELQLAGRPPLPYDLLSIGIGSVPSRVNIGELDSAVVPIKPMWSFLDRLATRLLAIGSATPGGSVRVVVVGGGAGGVEIALCLPPFVRSVLGPVPLELALVDAGDRVASGMGDVAARLAGSVLERRGVRLVLGRRVTRAAEGVVALEGGEVLTADLVLWATGAVAPPILATSGLAVDDRGFLLTRPTLQTLDDEAIFAVGDSGTVSDSPAAKAGVFAVRQGPVLWRNLARQLGGGPLEPFVPQRQFLKLLNTGGGSAIGEYRGFARHGRVLRRLKDFIDGRFMDRLQDYRPMSARRTAGGSGAQDTLDHEPPRCLGCGGKVAASVLARALERLAIPADPRVTVGLGAPDDAAIVRVAESGEFAVTADFFAAPLDDPYLVGRLSALHAASDAFAIGAKPRFALALLTIPLGPSHQQERIVFETLLGALREFERMGVSLVGGHTIEGPTLTVGFTVLADPSPGPPRTKGSFRAGDSLVLTKPLGAGILLAAHMRARCRAGSMGPLLESMLASNAEAADLLDAHDVRGVTDVTGFGLAGHLFEGLRASGLDAELELPAIPLLPGVAELVALGVESTLASANRAVENAIESSAAQRRSPAYAALFDPQTCGGLILGVAEAGRDDLIRSFRERGVPAAWIGLLRGGRGGPPRITLA